MLDLVVLLGISLAVTAILGLVWIGFVWAPWLIGFILVGLLIVLLKVTATPDQPPLASELEGESSVASSPKPTSSPKPAASFKSVSVSSSTSADAEVPDPVMVYRGVKYKRPPESSNAAPSATQGKYRGQQWSRD